MGYTTDFKGSVSVTPPLNPYEIAYLKRFADTRRMHRRNGPYFTGSGFAGQDHEADIVDYNSPPPEQFSLWNHWVSNEYGTTIEWDGGEKFHNADEWMTYIIDTFLKPGATVAAELASPVPGRVYAEEFDHFTFDHVVNGTIEAQGEDAEDRWRLVVTANVVTKQQARIVWDSED